MPCIDNTGEITEMAKKILTVMTRKVSLQQVADQSEAPLYRIRGAVRELIQAGFVEEIDQLYLATEAGLAALNKTSVSTPAPEPPN